MTATPPTATASSPRRRRGFQFSLRTLFIVTLACSIPLAWLAAERRKNDKALADMKALEELGVSIDFASSKPPRSKWRQMVFGDESHLDVVREASFDNPPITDAGLKHLNGLTNLERLWMNRTQVTDAGLENLKCLTKLEEWTLDIRQVTDAGLEGNFWGHPANSDPANPVSGNPLRGVVSGPTRCKRFSKEGSGRGRHFLFNDKRGRMARVFRALARVGQRADSVDRY